MQKRYDYCPNCMQAIQDNTNICKGCGFDLTKYEEKEHIKPCTILKDKYMIGKVIGEGGFGVTYKGWDMVLQTYVAIKEYFPQFFAHRSANNSYIVPTAAQKESYEKGLRRYLEEAQNLSKFYQLSGIVSVKDFFYENGTGYIVMEYIDGINLKQYLDQSGGKIPEAKVCALMKPVLESLMEVHETGLIHRDISPDNVMVDRKNRIKLIDFGSVRGQSTADEKTYTVTLKHGYAPSEQYYAKGKQGPWTDIYSICATMYRMLTGQNPPNSIERMAKDEYVSPSYYGVNVSQKMEYVLRKGLAVKAEDRYQNIGYLIQDLYYNNLQLQNNGMQNNNQYRNTNMQNNNQYQNTNIQNNSQYQNTNIHNNRQYQNSSMQNNNQYPYNQQYNKPTNGPQKSKKWIPIVVTSILAVVLIVVISSVVKSKDKEYESDNDIRKTETVNTSEANTTETVVQNNTTETDTDTGIYSENGIKLVLPELYEYDAANSEDGLLMYEKDDRAFFMIFSEPTNGASEEECVGAYEESLNVNYNSNAWKKTKTSYNGYSCTEFRDIVEKDGVVFNTVAVVSYFGDTYMFLIYMDLDIDKGDSEYYSAMNTLQYIE